MKNGRKVILGVALSFMILFTAIGYAYVQDELSISGTLNAEATKALYITDIKHQSGLVLNNPTITDLTSITASVPSGGTTSTYMITVYNNDPDATYIFTGASGNVDVATSMDIGGDVPIPSAVGTGHASGPLVDGQALTLVEYGEPFTFYVTYDLTTATGDIVVDFIFQPVIYQIEYINNGETLDVRYVYDNSSAVETANTTAATAAQNQMTNSGYNVTFAYWMNAGSTQTDSVDKDNTENVILYPKFTNLYTAMFLNQDGSLLDWTFFTFTDTSNLIEMADDLAESFSADGELTFDYWEVHVTDENGNTTTKLSWDDYWNQNPLTESDIAIYPVYKYNGDVQLIPVDNDGDGETDEYQVGGYNNDTGSELVEIPQSVNGVDITEINASAFDIYDDLHAVRIPATVTTIGSATFSDGIKYQDTFFGEVAIPYQRETVTLYYEGEPDAWEAYMDKLYLREGYSHRDAYIESNSASSGDDLSSKVVGDGFADDWDNNMGDGSRVFFVDVDENGDAHVNYDKGYWELTKDGSAYFWVFYSTVPTDMAAEYTGTCDCDLGEHSREDAIYWEGVTATTASEEETTTPEEETTP